MADRFDVVAVGIDHERGVIVGMVVRAQARGAVVGRARSQGRGMESIDGGAAICGKGDVTPGTGFGPLVQPVDRPFSTLTTDLLAAGELRRHRLQERGAERCHRRIIADYLLAEGEAVFHILSADSIRPAQMTPEARRTPEGLVYPAP